jgi:hypothetical protein
MKQSRKGDDGPALLDKISKANFCWIAAGPTRKR